MNNVIKMKRKGYLGLTKALGQKPSKNLRQKMTRKLRLDRRGRERRKMWIKFWKSNFVKFT